jgi:hypothetical protein
VVAVEVLDTSQNVRLQVPDEVSLLVLEDQLDRLSNA